MGQGGGSDVQFRLNVSHYHSFRVGGQQDMHDSQPGFRAHGRQHIRKAREIDGGTLLWPFAGAGDNFRA
jgi:hypothetical protein